MSPLAAALVAELRAHPRHFGELVEAHMTTPWRDFLLAWGELRTSDILGRDDAGRYVIKSDSSEPRPLPSFPLEAIVKPARSGRSETID